MMRPQGELSRRALLTGAAGLAVVTACGKSSRTTSPEAGTSVKAASAALVPRFDVNDYTVTQAEQRLVVSMLDSRRQTPSDLPSELNFSLARNGEPIGSEVHATLHGQDIDAPYYPVVVTIHEAGTYTISADWAQAPDSSAFRVQSRSEVRLVQPGDAMPRADTPTLADAQGVDPICTRSAGPCPYHDINLRDALTSGKPTALLISTPRFCQMHICGPVLQLLVEQQSKYPELNFVHAEVYRRPLAENTPAASGLAPVVDALGLTFEPSLFMIGADATVAARLDSVFDRTEATAALDRLAGRN